MTERQNPNGRGVQRLVKAFMCSMAGFRFIFSSEAAFRQELLIVLILLPVAYAAGDTAAERVLLIGVLFLVLIVEVINTAIEVVIDRISADIHPLSKHAKDLGSAAVLLSLVVAVICWMVILS